jgi:hypothetical protein
MIVSIGAKRALERLSKRSGVTKCVLVERLIADAEQEATGRGPSRRRTML